MGKVGRAGWGCADRQRHFRAVRKSLPDPQLHPQGGRKMSTGASGEGNSSLVAAAFLSCAFLKGWSIFPAKQLMGMPVMGIACGCDGEEIGKMGFPPGAAARSLLSSV